MRHLWRLSLAVLFVVGFTWPALAQRELYWDAVDVDARLDASGRLYIDEVQTMVFTGDWNGGERVFNIRPQQSLESVEIFREVGGRWEPLLADSSVDDVDEYTWSGATELRWRSRRPDDPPFARTPIRYLLRYQLTNILLKDGDTYQLDHDFLFPDRDEEIREFTLKLTLDPAWQPIEAVPATYTAASVPPGEGFVLTIPMRHAGPGVPEALDTTRRRPVTHAVTTLLVVTMLTVLWVIGREWTRGRFAPIETHVDETWLQQHVLRHPAEVVGAAWDELVGSPEVVALIARMVSEGKLESEVGKGNVMHLRLKVKRDLLLPHERKLIDRLFFNDRVTTNTQLVKQHYRKSGFNPSIEITPELEAAVAAAIPEGRRPRPLQWAPLLLFSAGALLLGREWWAQRLETGWFFGPLVVGLILAAFALWSGSAFRWSITWGAGRALLCLVPGVASVLLTAWFLWERIGPEFLEATDVAVWGAACVALWILAVNANAMVSRQYSAGIAFRKRLAAARAFFAAQLREERPQLRDEWTPWLLALGLVKEMDDWSVRHAGDASRSASRSSRSATSISSSSGASAGAWTGFSGGRSGGGGGGAAWTTAASGLAAGVAPPSSSRSSGGGSSSSSSSGSSGGGGGGGW